MGISKLVRKLAFGDNNIENKEKNIVNETLGDIKDQYRDQMAKEQKDILTKGKITTPKNLDLNL